MATPKMATPKKATPKKATPKKAAPKAATKKPATKPAAPKKPVAKKAAVSKPAAKKAPPKAAAKKPAPSKRDLYVTKLKAQIDVWDADLKILEAKAAKLSGEAKTKYAKQLAEVEKGRKEGEKLLKKVKAASDDAWVVAKAEAEKAWKAFTAAVKTFKSEYK